jgi:hypothetical protein
MAGNLGEAGAPEKAGIRLGRATFHARGADRAAILP